MASITAHSPAINYLTDAAHMLRYAAPETSAHLLSQRAALLYAHDTAPSDLQRQHVCGACGHIMVPGHATELKLKTSRTARTVRRKAPRSASDKTAKPGSARERSKDFSCGFCARVTRIPLSTPEAITRRKVAKSASSEILKPATANASSKKRAKNRKAGLQALLSGQQQRQSNPLSLASFMKK
ncbi:hypothetical protein ACQKWADRAFT_143455 [Trichoderma austrokoningii]